MAIRTRSSDWLAEHTWRRLTARIDTALTRARSRGAAALVSVTQELEEPVDAVALALASRLPDEAWFCFEQPEHEGFAVAGLGCAHELRGQGSARFDELGRTWRELAGTAVADQPSGPPGTGLVAMGGFAFDPEGAASPEWDGFAPASLIVPELGVTRRAGASWLTVNLTVRPDDTADALLAGVRQRLRAVRIAPLPLLDPAPVGTFRVHSPMPPSHYEEAVARAIQRIRAGELEKVVLAREVRVQAPGPHDAAAILGVLRDGFPSCFVYAVGRGGRTFLGASPELLVRREGQRASTVALAGSTRRSADPSVDDHLGERLLQSTKDRHENAIVARRIARQLAPLSVWVTVAPDPTLIRVANIQHLAAPIRAQLAAPIGAVELAGRLHPTPAVGGEPRATAERLIPALEGLDRGWYAGPLGWTDVTGDGEFCVALRCALLHGATASCYAGCGIVADSDPAAELAETEVKLQAMLPVVSG